MNASTANRSAAGSMAGCFATAHRNHVDVREIERLSLRGVGVQNISMQLGCSMEDVRRVLAPVSAPANDDRLAEPVPVPVPVVIVPPATTFRSERDQRFKGLWEAGVPRSEICGLLKISNTRLDSIRTRLRLPPRRAGRAPEEWTPAQDAALRSLYIVGGMSAAAASKKIGKTPGAVRGRAKRLGLAIGRQAAPSAPR